MEIQKYQFTIEDVLTVHRAWIEKLFLDDRKTEVEIVMLLDQRKLIVTLHQLQRCINNWGLVPPKPSISTSTPSKDLSSRPSTYAIDDDIAKQYKTRPLPSLPPITIPSQSQSTQEPSPHQTPEVKPRLSLWNLSPDEGHYTTAPPSEDLWEEDELNELGLGVALNHKRARDLREGSNRTFSPARGRKRVRGGMKDREREETEEDETL